MSISRDTGYNLAAAVAPGLFMLAVIPFYIHAIGAERFGVLAICWTIVSALRFASLGMGPSLTYRLATMDDAPVGSRSSLVWTALILALAASALGAVLVLGISKVYFSYFFSASSALDAEIRQAMPLLAAGLPVALVIGVLNGALQGMRRFAALSTVTIINAALVTALPLVVALLFSVRLDGLILATMAANILAAMIELGICARLVPLRLSDGPKRSDVPGLMGYGAWMSGTALIAPLVILLDRFVIGALRGPAAVAAYVLPYNLVQQLVLLPASLTSAVLPRLAPLTEDEVRQMQSSALQWLNGLLTPITIIAIAFAAPFLGLWIGPTLARIASPVAVILLVGAWVHGIGHVPSTIVVGRRRPDLLTKLLLAYLVPYVAILYVATLRFGVVGAATAWTIRAAFDPILFAFTRPYSSDLRSVLLSGALVFAAMVAALALRWTSSSYWVLGSVILVASCYQHRRVLSASATHWRRMRLSSVPSTKGVEVLIGENGL